MNKILLNNKPRHFQENDLPCLIHYKHGEGGSLLSVSIIADLFASGSKILFLTAYPMAKDEFIKQIGDSSKIQIITDEKQVDEDAQAIIVESGNENLYLKVIEKLNEIDQRIIFLKNFEIFSPKTIESAINKQKVIYSGNVDKCSSREKIISKNFNTTIFFSKTSINTETDKIIPPKLDKYSGFIESFKENGIIRIKN